MFYRIGDIIVNCNEITTMYIETKPSNQSKVLVLFKGISRDICIFMGDRQQCEKIGSEIIALMENEV